LPSGALVGAVTLFDNQIAAFIVTSDNLLQIYNTTSLDILNVNPGAGYVITSTSLAMDRVGNPMFLASLFGTGKITVFRGFPSPDASIFNSIKVYTTELTNGVTILNDNQYNIYLIEGSRFVTLDVYTSPAQATELFSVSGNYSIRFAAVYYADEGPTVYYMTTQSANTLYTFQGNTTTESTLADFFDFFGLVVDGNNELSYIYKFNGALLFTTVYQLHFLKFILIPLALYLMTDIAVGYTGLYYVSNLYRQLVVGPSLPVGFAVSPAGDRYMLGIPSLSGGSPEFGFIFGAIGTGKSYYEPITNNYYFGAGWFACESQVSFSTQRK